MEITQTQTTPLALTEVAGSIDDEQRLADDAARGRFRVGGVSWCGAGTGGKS